MSTQSLPLSGSQNPEHWNQLFDARYALLERRAQALLRAERRDHTLDASSLVHEAYARLAGVSDPQTLNEGYLMGAASRAMRCVLIDHARRRGRSKRGGAWQRTSLEAHATEELPFQTETPDELMALEEALARLKEFDEGLSEVVELRFLAGLTVEETAKAIGRSERSVKRDWAYARAWLYRSLEDLPEVGSESASSAGTR